MPNGPLTLPARLFLLAWDTDRRVVADPARLPPLVRAGALTELARRGLLTDDDGIATPLDLDSRTGDAVLDGLLELVSESCPHRWHAWVTLRARHTFDAVREQLVAEGLLRARRRRVLGVFPSVEYALDGIARAAAVQEGARDVLDGTRPVAGTPRAETDAALLGAVAGLRTLRPGHDRAGHERRVEELLAAPAPPPAVPVLREIVRGLRTAVPAAPAPSLTPGA
ncbi:GPP34 family phosphoprotein [Streptomyces sp. H28]|uniref:GOLPH3/VPS74 family protein n=1 Tax=Streptomyces sp. H28 TaxID=2775865 RepID=UPI00177E7ADB|nr:GPP34 family phosphoprotein [Streptomyces sp. H28]MBD9731776.1 GPP34 family phosphoprotein [Streptomyces sp. H28]